MTKLSAQAKPAPPVHIDSPAGRQLHLIMLVLGPDLRVHLNLLEKANLCYAIGSMDCFRGLMKALPPDAYVSMRENAFREAYPALPWYYDLAQYDDELDCGLSRFYGGRTYWPTPYSFSAYGLITRVPPRVMVTPAGVSELAVRRTLRGDVNPLPVLHGLRTTPTLFIGSSTRRFMKALSLMSLTRKRTLQAVSQLCDLVVFNSEFERVGCAAETAFALLRKRDIIGFWDPNTRYMLTRHAAGRWPLDAWYPAGAATYTILTAFDQTTALYHQGLARFDWLFVETRLSLRPNATYDHWRESWRVDVYHRAGGVYLTRHRGSWYPEIDDDAALLDDDETQFGLDDTDGW